MRYIGVDVSNCMHVTNVNVFATSHYTAVVGVCVVDGVCNVGQTLYPTNLLFFSIAAS